MNKHSFEFDIDDHSKRVLEKEDEVDNNYTEFINDKLIHVIEKLTWTGRLVNYNGGIKLVYFYSKRVKVDWWYRPDLAVNKLVVINGQTMDELSL